ncbi:MAG: hypothetical protein SWH61_17045 [Thermodesulfobacteriota bacterium]|nr:hypothetical protein [Thermodesulfobacteriota bacterium]
MPGIFFGWLCKKFLTPPYVHMFIFSINHQVHKAFFYLNFPERLIGFRDRSRHRTAAGNDYDKDNGRQSRKTVFFVLTFLSGRLGGAKRNPTFRYTSCDKHPGFWAHAPAYVAEAFRSSLAIRHSGQWSEAAREPESIIKLI